MSGEKRVKREHNAEQLFNGNGNNRRAGEKNYHYPLNQSEFHAVAGWSLGHIVTFPV